MTVTFNPFDPAFATNPYPHWAELRAEDPVHETPLGLWLLLRYDDAVRFVKDPALSVEDANATPNPMFEAVRQAAGLPTEGPRPGDLAMLNRDAPDHTRLRRLVSKAFTARRVEELRPLIDDFVAQALDRAAEAGEMEVIGDLAFPLPFVVISHMMGMPDTDTNELRRLSGTLVGSLEPIVDPERLKAIAAAGEQMRELISAAIAWKRKEPTDDLLSALIAAEEQGDVLSDEELTEQVMLLYIAGHETTVNLIGNGPLALLRNRDQLARLAADPALTTNAVEELLRYDPPVQLTRRITLDDVEVGGKTIAKGSFVGLVIASANRDAARWGDTAEQLDLGRDGAGHHLAFGGGIHHCLGSALARMEGQAAIGSLVQRFPALELAGEPEWNGRINLRGLDRLPVTV